MRIRINIKECAIELIEYLFAILLILECNSIWQYTVDSSLYKVVRVALILVLMIYLMINKSISAAGMKAILLAVFIAAMYCLIYTFAVGSNVKGFFFIAVCAVAVYSFVVVATDKNRGALLLIKYKNLIVIIAAVSLFFWLFGSQLGIINATGYVDLTWGVTDGSKQAPSYYGVYFEAQTIRSFLGMSISVRRNTAIFTEAPMCNFHFCIALIIELFYCRKPSKVKCMILILAVLSTLSTTGYCLMIIALVSKYIFTKGISKFQNALKIFIIPAILIIGLILFQTLLMDKMSTSSGGDRLTDFVTGFNAFLESPLLGYGYGEELYFKYVHYGFSNSITPILGYGGLFLAIPYLYFIIKWAYRSAIERDIQKFLLFVNFMFLFTITIVSFRFLAMFFLFASCIPREKDAVKNGAAARHKSECSLESERKTYA